MKKTIYFLFISILFNGCVSLHNGYLTGVAPPSENNFTYIGTATGKAQATYILGIGGFLREGLVREAKNNLVANSPLKKGQVLVNYTIDRETSFYLGLVWTNRVIITADILQYEE
jgi:hypothetical protein